MEIRRYLQRQAYFSILQYTINIIYKAIYHPNISFTANQKHCKKTFFLMPSFSQMLFFRLNKTESQKMFQCPRYCFYFVIQFTKSVEFYPSFNSNQQNNQFLFDSQVFFFFHLTSYAFQSVPTVRPPRPPPSPLPAPSTAATLSHPSPVSAHKSASHCSCPSD